MPKDQFVQDLASQVESFKPPAWDWNRHQSPSLPPALATCQFVFLRHGPRQSPLVRPYDGPYLVVTRSPKSFLLRIGSKESSVSVDWVKPAFMWLPASPSVPDVSQVPVVPLAPVPLRPDAPSFVPPLRTRAGREVRRPVKLDL